MSKDDDMDLVPEGIDGEQELTDGNIEESAGASDTGSRAEDGAGSGK